jgi:hypothetical protein
MAQSLLIKIPDIISVSLMVIYGMYGNGDERKKKLEAEGYDYSRVQSCVNDLLKLMEKYK